VIQKAAVSMPAFTPWMRYSAAARVLKTSDLLST
jgi:hypothetical protein